jgi:PAS domain S-box-containing protein
MTVPEPAFEMMVRGVQDYAIFMLDPSGHVRTWNTGAEKIKGYPAGDIIGRHFSVFYPPEDLAAGKPARELETAIAEGRLEDEGWRIRQDGTRFWANVVITALFDDTGTLRGFAKVTRDMTDRRAAEHELRTREEQFRLLVHGVVDYAIFMLDPAGRIVTWNAGAERIKGYAAEEIIGRHFSIFYPPEDLAAEKPARELETAIAEGRLEDEGWRIRQDGTRFWANVVITALFDDTGNLYGFGKVTRDMTERRAAEQTLSDRQRLVAHLVEAQELERRRIAWDVHDDSIQAMVAVGMRLEMLAARLPDEHRPAVRQLDDAVRGSVARLRELIFRLRPPSIDEGGLADALAGYLADVVAAWSLASSLRYELEAEPPTETAITIFRICQEALANTHKHAQANFVEIVLTTVPPGVLVQVIDDGVGIGDLSDALPEHFGLIEMRERAETVGGWCSARPGATRGTVVEFWLPVPR